MMLYFSHLHLSPSPSVKALSSLLQPEHRGERLSAYHKLLWSVFADSEERQRDFLWRAEGEGSFLTLSLRPPMQNDLFLPHRVKPYQPEIKAGERFRFQIRTNATRKLSNGKRVDVVMHALYSFEQSERSGKRMELANQEGISWLQRQGEKAGFAVEQAVVEDYSVHTLPRAKKSKAKDAATFGILELQGIVEVQKPDVFLKYLSLGFGRAKSFGCGLMLLKRAP